MAVGAGRSSAATRRARKRPKGIANILNCILLSKRVSKRIQADARAHIYVKLICV